MIFTHIFEDKLKQEVKTSSNKRCCFFYLFLVDLATIWVNYNLVNVIY
jgi:hypothetical protein